MLNHAFEARKAWTQLLIIGGALIAALAAGCSSSQPVSTSSEFESFRAGQPKRKAQVTLSGVDLSDLAELKSAPKKKAFSSIRMSVELCDSDSRCTRRNYEVQYGRSHRSIAFKPAQTGPDGVWAGDLDFLLAESDSEPSQFRETLNGFLHLELNETKDEYVLKIAGNLVLGRDKDSDGGRTVETKITDDTGQIPVQWESRADKHRLEEAYNRIPPARPRYYK